MLNSALQLRYLRQRLNFTSILTIYTAYSISISNVKELVGVFSVIVKSSRTFVWSSSGTMSCLAANYRCQCEPRPELWDSGTVFTFAGSRNLSFPDEDREFMTELCCDVWRASSCLHPAICQIVFRWRMLEICQASVSCCCGFDNLCSFLHWPLVLLVLGFLSLPLSAACMSADSYEDFTCILYLVACHVPDITDVQI